MSVPTACGVVKEVDVLCVQMEVRSELSSLKHLTFLGALSGRSKKKDDKKVYQEGQVRRGRSLLRKDLDLWSVAGIERAMKETKTQMNALRRRRDRARRGLSLSPVLGPKDDTSEGEDVKVESAGSSEDDSSELSESDSLDDDEPIVSHLRKRGRSREGKK